MNESLEYLHSFLQEEFKSFPDVRVQLTPRAGTQRSQDLPQDYDPEAHDLHNREGVYVRTSGREYYFPLAWIKNKEFARVRDMAQRIRESL